MHTPRSFLRLLTPLTLTTCFLASCGGEDSSSPTPVPGGFNLGGFGSDINNTSDKTGFMKKAKQASQLAEKGKSSITSVGTGIRASVSEGTPLAFEVARLENAMSGHALSFSPAIDSPEADVEESEDWGSFSEDQDGMTLDFGQSMGKAENCTDAIRSVKQEYENTLSMVQAQFEMLKQIDSLKAGNSGFKAIDVPNRALAYTFTEQGMSGSIEGAADDARILVKMTMAGQFGSQPPSEGPGTDCPILPPEGQDSGDFDGAWPPSSGDAEGSFPPIENPCSGPVDPSEEPGASEGHTIFTAAPMESEGASSMKIDVGFIANLQSEVIDIVTNMETTGQAGQSMNLQMQGRVAGGENPQMSQTLKATLKNSESEQPTQFEMTLSVAQVEKTALEIRLQSSGINSGEMTVPAFNQTLILRPESDGSCSLASL